MTEAKKKKEDMRLRRTYKLLVGALWGLLEEKSFDEIHVNEICERAMVHRTTFYKHFEDKNQLLTFCIQQIQEDFIEKYLLNKSFENPKQYYMSVLRYVLSFLLENRKRVLLVTDERGGDSVSKMLHAWVVQRVIDDMIEYEKKGIQYRVPIPVIAEYHVGAMMALARWWLLNDSPVSTDDILRYVDQMTVGIIDESQ
jgi:AcrR family transcriptional regulator